MTKDEAQNKVQEYLAYKGKTLQHKEKANQKGIIKHVVFRPEKANGDSLAMFKPEEEHLFNNWSVFLVCEGAFLIKTVINVNHLDQYVIV